MACGKKGPPLPPLIKVPVAPVDFTAERRGDEVRLQFTVPAANSDGTRPANVERMEIYRFTGPATATDEQVLKFGTSVASVPVKAPRNPDITTEADEPPEQPDLEEEGLDQGAIAQIEDMLVPAALTPVQLPQPRGVRLPRDDRDRPRPLVGPPPAVPSTQYAIVGINTRGRKGPLSKRIPVPLVPAPSAPGTPAITYDENTITVTWTAPPSAQDAATADVLPSHPVGIPMPSYDYHVYDVSPSAVDPSPNPASPSVAGQIRLTMNPIGATRYQDTRMDWGATRCYTVRVLETIGALTLESESTEPACTTLKDEFPPAAPKDLRPVAAEGVISLIWEPNNEDDLAGYIVLRGPAPGDMLLPITPMPINATTFNDTVAAGVRYVYAVQAVDRAGNVSATSERVDEAAR